jgi:aerobic carbon-monoxide dehydrogenase medium subunit
MTVYPAKFDYHPVSTIDEALSLLDQLGDEAKVLAGGQSLIPMMKLRFAVPQALIDINRIDGFDQIADDSGALRIGALVRHKACEYSPALRGRFGVLGDAAPQISDPIVRNLGTVAGSLAHADPQGDWASAMLAADAEVIARSAGGERTIGIEDLLRGPFETTLEPNEIIAEVRVPDPGSNTGGTYMKLERKVGDFATVGVAVQVSLQNGKVARAGIALTGVGPINFRASSAEAALLGSELDDDAITGAARLAADAAEPRGDLRGSADYKRNVVRIFTERGLRAAAARARGEHDAAPISHDFPRAVARPPGQETGADYFAGEETLEGVMDEVREKEDD